MALHDNKKAATIRNLWHLQVTSPVFEANAKVAAIRAAIVGNDLADNFSAAERDAMLAVESALTSLAALPGITAAESKYRPNHTTEPEIVGLET